MKIILLGYGKMGRTIEKIAVGRGHEISARIDVDNQDDFDSAEGDVAIEFSHPDAAYTNITKCLLRKLPIVCYRERQSVYPVEVSRVEDSWLPSFGSYQLFPRALPVLDYTLTSDADSLTQFLWH